MSHPKIRLFLVHDETGQRYPIRSDVVIGRIQGDLVFSRDTNLSQEHCRISLTDTGLLVQDLNSANGTMINGKRISAHRPYPLGVGDELCVGHQAFTAMAVTKARATGKRRRRKQGFDTSSIFLTLMLGLVGAGLGWIYRHQTPFLALRSPMQSTQRELGEIFENYANLRTALERQSTPPREVAVRIKSQILIRLNGLSTRLSEITSGDAREKQMLNLEQYYIAALTNHAKARIRLINDGGDLSTQEEIDSLDEKLDQIAGEYRELIDPHGTPNPGLPMQVQSPLQIVEKEMRRALFSYKMLGAQVHDAKVTDKEMANTIRNELIPKLTSVAAKLGVIKPQNPMQARRVALEQKLTAAFLGQVKAMAAFVDSQDPKYAKEQEKWGSEIEKLNAELKGTTPRAPAGSPDRH